MREALSDTAEMVEGEDASLTKMIETLLEGQPVTLTLTLMPPTPTPNPNPNPFPTSTTSSTSSTSPSASTGQLAEGQFRAAVEALLKVRCCWL